MIRFAVAKVAVILFAQELQRHLDEHDLPIISVSIHPGAVATEGVMINIPGPFAIIAHMTMLSPDQGAVMPLFAATAEEIRNNPEKYKGRYLEPLEQVVAPNRVNTDEEQVRGLWENTTIQVNKYLI